MRSFLFILSILSLASSAGAANENIRIDQNWTEAEKATYYSLYEGSQIMPARWYLGLERSNSQQLLSKTMDDFGFIADGQSLPVGVVIHEDEITQALYKEKQWMGVNCMACHSSQVKINGKGFIIEGGSNLFDIQKFENEIVSAVTKTLDDPAKWQRFTNALQTSEKEKQAELKMNMQLFVSEFGSWVKRNHTYLSSKGENLYYGPSRMDGIGGPTNDLTCQLTPRMGDENLAKIHNQDRNCQTSLSPSTIPHLWGIGDNMWVQWDGGVHSSLGRNWGQSTGTYAKNWIEKDATGTIRFKSTADINGLYQLEEAFAKLKSPSWKKLAETGLVPALNENKVQAGRVLYENKCQRCHSIQPEFSAPNRFGNSYWLTQIFSADEVGTDTRYLTDTSQRQSILPPEYNDLFKAAFGPQSVAADQVVTAGMYRAFVIRKMILDDFQEKKFGLDKMAAYTNCRDSSLVQTKLGLKARSLEGVGFTAPYLHNGSVESLYELLLPANERKKQFFIGCRNYDIAKMGYDCSEKDPNPFLFDTKLEGNSNAGHQYGTDLSEEQKNQLIEFMKSLEQPQSAPKNAACH